jgi:type I restriction enzyme S subunit
VPPLSEQAQICEELGRRTSEIDQLISSVRRHIDKLLECRTALITAAVTGQIDVREHAVC